MTKYRSIAFRLEDVGAFSLEATSESSSEWKIFHVVYLTLLNILIRTRKRVTRRAILGL